MELEVLPCLPSTSGQSQNHYPSGFQWNFNVSGKDATIASPVFGLPPYEAIKWQLTFRRKADDSDSKRGRRRRGGGGGPGSGGGGVGIGLPGEHLLEDWFLEDEIAALRGMRGGSRMECDLFLVLVHPQDDDINVKATIAFEGETRALNHKFTREAPEECIKGYQLLGGCRLNCVLDYSEYIMSHPHQMPSTDFEKMFKNQTMADVVFKVGPTGKDQIGAHKAFLIARSSVFEAMFQPNSREYQTNVIEINDMDMDVVNEMLNYIYSGKVGRKELIGPNLLNAAEKYDLQGLKTLCEKYMGSNISVNNAIDILLCADQYKADKLRKVAIGFIGKKTMEMKRSKAWKERMYKRPDLMDEVMDQLVKQ